MTEEELEVQVLESHDGISPAWVASARGASCGSEYSANDAVAALIEQLLKTGVITQTEADRYVVASPDGGSTAGMRGKGLLNRPMQRRSRTNY